MKIASHEVFFFLFFFFFFFFAHAPLNHPWEKKRILTVNNDFVGGKNFGSVHIELKHAMINDYSS